MAQKPTLIKNIILSEIEYERKRIKLLATDDVERGQLSDSMDRDHEIISTWCTNFGITKEEIEAKRIKILDDEYIDVLKVREIRDLLYHQGYTIGGARLRLEGHSKVEAQKAVATLQIKQLRGDLEELLRVLS